MLFNSFFLYSSISLLLSLLFCLICFRASDHQADRSRRHKAYIPTTRLLHPPSRTAHPPPVFFGTHSVLTYYTLGIVGYIFLFYSSAARVHLDTSYHMTRNLDLSLARDVYSNSKPIYSAGRCQPETTAVWRQPALLRILSLLLHAPFCCAKRLHRRDSAQPAQLCYFPCRERPQSFYSVYTWLMYLFRILERST